MAPARRRPGSFPLAHVHSSKTASRPASYSTLDHLAAPKDLNAGASHTPTSESGSLEPIYPAGASDTPCRTANPVPVPSIKPDATAQARTGEGALQDAKSVGNPKNTQAPGHGGQQWVNSATGNEGIDVSLTEGQVDGDPALQITSSNDEQSWDTVQLEAGDESSTAPENGKQDPEKGSNLNIVVWFGPTDPENPLNWSHTKRAFVAAQIYLLTVATYIGTSIYSPGATNVETSFGVSRVVASLGTTLAILGYAIGVMFWSPLSESIRIGRKPIYIGTLFVFVALQIPTVLAKNIEMLLVFRFLSGIFGSPVLGLGGASIKDMYSASDRGYAIVIWNVVSIVTPVLGPVIGGFAAQHNGWRWTIWTMMWLSGGTLLLLLFLMPETNAANILYRRSRRLRVLTGNENLRSEQDVVGGRVGWLETIERILVRPFVLAFTEPILLVLNTYIALINALLFSSLSSFPLIFEEIHGFNLGQTGLAYLGILVGSLEIVPPMSLYLRFHLQNQFNSSGELTPEKRLPPAMVGAFIVPLSLLIVGWSSRASVHWIVPIIGSSFFGVANVLLFYSILNYIPDAYPNNTACALAGNEFMRSTAGAATPLFVTAMFENLGIGWASTLLALLSCLFIPVPFVLYYRGDVIRGKSSSAKKDF